MANGGTSVWKEGETMEVNGTSITKNAYSIIGEFMRKNASQEYTLATLRVAARLAPILLYSADEVQAEVKTTCADVSLEEEPEQNQKSD